MSDIEKNGDENSFLKKLASRRFILVVLSLLISTILVATGKLDKVNFENIVVWLSGIYVVGRPFGDLVGTFLSKTNKN